MLLPLATRSLPALTALSPPTLSSSTLLAAAGTVDAPVWVLPLGAACMMLVPLLLVLASKQGGDAAAAALLPLQGTVVGGGGVDPILKRAKRFNDVRRRKRRERLMTRLTVMVSGTTWKGKGLFAQKAIPGGTYLFDYEGEQLDKSSYDARYPDRVSDYAVGIRKSDGTISFVDAANEQLSGLARFMNHDGERPNVARKTLFDGPTPRVVMYTTRDVEAGEELQWVCAPCPTAPVTPIAPSRAQRFSPC